MTKLLKLVSGTLAAKSLLWFQAYEVSKLDQKPETTWGKVAALLVPAWYSAFKIASLTPYQTPQNQWKHTLGKIFIPMSYTGFQLAKMKSPTTGNGEKALAVLLGPLYGVHASSVIAERLSPAAPATLAQSFVLPDMLPYGTPQAAIPQAQYIQPPMLPYPQAYPISSMPYSAAIRPY